MMDLSYDIIIGLYSFYSLMKKIFALLLAFLIVLGVYILMKKDTNPEFSDTIKTLLGLEKPSIPTTTIKKSIDTDINTAWNQILNKDDSIIIEKDTNMPDKDSVEQIPDNQANQVIDSLEKQEADTAKTDNNNNPVATGTIEELSPLQKAIRAKNQAQ